MPRGPQESQGLITTRSPGRRSRVAGPTSSTTPAASCPRMWGQERGAVSGLSRSPPEPGASPELAGRLLFRQVAPGLEDDAGDRGRLLLILEHLPDAGGIAPDRPPAL